MADFMREHVRLGEVARSLEAGSQLVIEREVDIDLLVARTVERADGGARGSAGGLHLTAEQHEFGRNVLGAMLLEEGGPGVFGVAEHRCDELALLICGSAALNLGLRA